MQLVHEATAGAGLLRLLLGLLALAIAALGLVGDVLDEVHGVMLGYWCWLGGKDEVYLVPVVVSFGW
jgi:hypothetical protein